MKNKFSIAGLLDWINTAVGAMGVMVMIALTFMTVIDIVMRRFFSMPLTFSYEVTQLLVVVIVFCSIPYSTNKLRHVSIEVLVDRFPEKYRYIVSMLGDFFCAFVLAMICWQAYTKGLYDKDLGTMTGELEIPLYPFYFFVSFGALLASLSLLLKTCLKMKEGPK